MSFQETFPDTINTNATKQPSRPQIIIANPLRKDIFVNSIQLAFDSYFSEKGVIMIKINDNIILPPKPSGSFKRLQNLPLSLKNQEFLDRKKIEIYAWNGTDNDFVSVGVDVQISEDPNVVISPDTPLSQDQKNSSISESEILFPLLERNIGSYPQLLDMKGYKKLIISMSNQQYHRPSVRSGGANIADGNLNTVGNTKNVNWTTGATVAEVDFGSIASRVPAGKVERVQADLGIWNMKLQTSNDRINWTTRVTKSTTQARIFTISGNLTSFRYLRMWAEHKTSTTGNRTFRCWELYDGRLLGGTASLSFEVKEEQTGSWIELISASAIGTVSQGFAIIKTIGDIEDDEPNGKFNYVLPSTQTNFRAVLQIAGSKNTSSISILKVG